MTSDIRAYLSRQEDRDGGTDTWSPGGSGYKAQAALVATEKALANLIAAYDAVSQSPANEGWASLDAGIAEARKLLPKKSK